MDETPTEKSLKRFTYHTYKWIMSTNREGDFFETRSAREVEKLFRNILSTVRVTRGQTIVATVKGQLYKAKSWPTTEPDSFEKGVKLLNFNELFEVICFKRGFTYFTQDLPLLLLKFALKELRLNKDLPVQVNGSTGDLTDRPIY